MKNLVYQFVFSLLVLLLSVSNLEGQAHKIRGKKGAICYDKEYAWRTAHTAEIHIQSNLKNEYMNCIAQTYMSGQINLHELRQRVGHGSELGDAISAIAWIHCSNAAADDCVLNYMKYLFELDSDQDGLEDLFDNTPFGVNTPPNTNPVDPDDQDRDGVPNDVDACPDTPEDEQVNAHGCPQVILQANSLKSFYPVSTEYFYISGKVYEPKGIGGLGGATIAIHYDQAIISDVTAPDGTFIIEVILQEQVPRTYNLRIEASHPDYANNETTVTFSVRPNLSINIQSDKEDYYANETIHLSGQVFSPEPIGSDLDIQCEITVYDAPDVEARAPYRIQRVPLRSDGTFSFDVPIYGPDEKGKWLESGNYGNWTVIATVKKDFEEKYDLLVVGVYRHQVDRDKVIRKYWDKLLREENIQTQKVPSVLPQYASNEAIILDSETNAILQEYSDNQQKIKIIDGAIMYLKDMRHRLTQNNNAQLQGRAKGSLVLEGAYIDCSSVNSAYLLETDPTSKTDRVTVFNGPITITSKNGKFSSFQLKNGWQLVANEEGILNQRSLSMKELQNAGQPFTAILDNTNPAYLRHVSDPYAEELSPDYQPGFEEILEDYAYYILAGIIGLGLLFFIVRKVRKGKTKVSTKPAHTPEAVQTTVSEPKTSTKDEGWETAGFCTQCGQAIPPGSKFCNACGAKQG